MKKLLIFLLALGLVTTLAAPSMAALFLVTSRGALGETDYIDWAQFGANGTVVTSPATSTSVGGLVQVELAPGPSFERRDQNIGWFGNFASGEALLWTNDNAGSMLIQFINPGANPVYGAGAQIQRDSYGDFTAEIRVYDPLFNLLGSFSLAGVSNALADDSAIFLGVGGDELIGYIAYRVDGGTQDFAIDRLSLTNQIPEPGTLLLLGSGLLGLAIAGTRKKFRK